MEYTKVTTDNGSEFIIRNNDDGSISIIPVDLTNSDYQRYLNPEAEQSTPILSDEAKTK